MRGFIIFLLCLGVFSCHQISSKPTVQLSDRIDTKWVDGPSDERTLYAYPIQPLDEALWALTQMVKISIAEGWEAHCFATRGRGPQNRGIRLDPRWTYLELIARAAFARPLRARHSGL